MGKSERLMKAQEIYDQAKLADDIERLLEAYNASPEHKQQFMSLYHGHKNGISIYFEDKVKPLDDQEGALE